MSDYQIIDHGVWERYTPNPLPPWMADLPPGTGAMFARRVGDNFDWYEYRAEPSYWGENPVVCTVLKNPRDDIETVKAVLRNGHLDIFPAGSRVIEIRGHDVEDGKPHNEFAWMIYDAATNTLLPAEPLPALVTVVFKVDFYRRMTEDEAGRVEALVAEQPIRQRRIFESANTFRSDAPEWANLVGLTTALFGSARASEILAPSGTPNG